MQSFGIYTIVHVLLNNNNTVHVTRVKDASLSAYRNGCVIISKTVALRSALYACAFHYMFVSSR